jgi:hypothetical protein
MQDSRHACRSIDAADAAALPEHTKCAEKCMEALASQLHPALQEEMQRGEHNADS